MQLSIMAPFYYSAMCLRVMSLCMPPTIFGAKHYSYAYSLAPRQHQYYCKSINHYL